MYIGIDPGNTGAIACLNDALECLKLYDMPVMAKGAKSTQVNAVELADMLRGWKMSGEDQVTVYLEQVSAMPGQCWCGQTPGKSRLV
jgi:crossover junction endodeoxyribonuclease RuvC